MAENRAQLPRLSERHSTSDDVAAIPPGTIVPSITGNHQIAPFDAPNRSVTPEWLSDLAGRIFDLSGEVELRFGEPGPCQYPSEVEMLLHMAHNAAMRKSREMKAAAPDA